VVVAGLLVLVPVLPERKRADDLDERDFNLAVALLREPIDADGAATLVRGLTQAHVADPRVLVLGAEVDYRLARRLLDTPGASETDALAGVVLQFLGRWDEAEER